MRFDKKIGFLGAKKNSIRFLPTTILLLFLGFFMLMCKYCDLTVLIIDIIILVVIGSLILIFFVVQFLGVKLGNFFFKYCVCS